MRKIEGAKMDINMLLVWEKYAEVHTHTHTYTHARAHYDEPRLFLACLSFKLVEEVTSRR